MDFQHPSECTIVCKGCAWRLSRQRLFVSALGINSHCLLMSNVFIQPMQHGQQAVDHLLRAGLRPSLGRGICHACCSLHLKTSVSNMSTSAFWVLVQLRFQWQRCCWLWWSKLAGACVVQGTGCFFMLQEQYALLEVMPCFGHGCNHACGAQWK